MQWYSKTEVKRIKPKWLILMAHGIYKSLLLENISNVQCLPCIMEFHHGICIMKLGVYSHRTEYIRVVWTHRSSSHSMFCAILALTQSWSPKLLGWPAYQLDHDNIAPVLDQRNSPSRSRSLRPIQILALPGIVQNYDRKPILLGWMAAVLHEVGLVGRFQEAT